MSYQINAAAFLGDLLVVATSAHDGGYSTGLFVAIDGRNNMAFEGALSPPGASITLLASRSMFCGGDSLHCYSAEIGSTFTVAVGRVSETLDPTLRKKRRAD